MLPYSPGGYKARVRTESGERGGGVEGKARAVDSGGGGDLQVGDEHVGLRGGPQRPPTAVVCLSERRRAKRVPQQPQGAIQPKTWHHVIVWHTVDGI